MSGNAGHVGIVGANATTLFTRSVAVDDRVFLAIAMTVLALVLLVQLLVQRRESAPIAIACLALGAAIAVVLTLPYARPYLENARLLGSRGSEDVCVAR